MLCQIWRVFHSANGRTRVFRVLWVYILLLLRVFILLGLHLWYILLLGFAFHIVWLVQHPLNVFRVIHIKLIKPVKAILELLCLHITGQHVKVLATLTIKY